MSLYTWYVLCIQQKGTTVSYAQTSELICQISSIQRSKWPHYAARAWQSLLIAYL